MKYIKLFENHDKLYHSISQEEWEEAVGYYDDSSTTYVPFNDKEISTINDIIGDSSISKPESSSYNGILTYDDIDLSITKLDDQWYYIMDSLQFEFYKCDTFDGLKDCLIKIID
jgi:hypothetical protein